MSGVNGGAPDLRTAEEGAGSDARPEASDAGRAGPGAPAEGAWAPGASSGGGDEGGRERRAWKGGRPLAAALVALVALADLWVAIRPGLRPIPAEAMAEAAEAARERRVPGALVVHSPLFGVAELAPLGDLSAGPDHPDPLARAGRRILLVDRMDAPMGGFGSADEVVPIAGDLALRVFEPRGGAGGERPIFDVRDGIGPGLLTIERPPGRLAARCDRPRPEGGFGCPGQPEWLHVQPRRLRIDGRDADCVWAHPTAGGVVVFELPPPPAPAPGHRLELRLGAALTDDAVRLTGDGAAVTTRVRQRGRTLGQVVRTNAIGWARGRFAVAPGEPVRLEITAPRDGRRHHCIVARIVETREGAGK